MPSTSNINIILADDHELFRDGFVNMIREATDITLLAEAANGDQLVRLVKQYQPEVVLTDVRMPMLDGIEATRIIKEKFPTIQVIALTMSGDEPTLIRMLSAGVSGYLNKDARKEEIREAIRTVVAGGTYYSKDIVPKVTKLISSGKFDPHTKTLIEQFTPIEKKVISYICDELTAREIAPKLKMSVRAVQACCCRILVKMNVRNQAGLIFYAIRNGLYDPEEKGRRG